MFALIQKAFEGNEILPARIFIHAYCGSPSEIVLRFINSGVKEQYRTAWMQCGGQLGEQAIAPNKYLKASENNQVTREQLEELDFAILDWSYKCIGCAETQDEANTLTAYLDNINANKENVSAFRLKRYTALVDAIKTNFEELQIEELQKLVSEAMDLNL